MIWLCFILGAAGLLVLLTRLPEGWSNLLVGLVAAGAWLPWLLERMERPRLRGRIVSWYIASPFTDVDKDLLKKREDAATGSMYCLRLSLLCQKRDLAIKKRSIRVRYSGHTESIAAVEFSGRGAYMHMVEGFELPAGNYPIHVPDELNLAFTTALEKDRESARYTFFIVPGVLGHRSLDVERIELTLTDYNDRSYDISFWAEEIDNRTLLFDRSILTSPPQSTPEPGGAKSAS